MSESVQARLNRMNAAFERNFKANGKRVRITIEQVIECYDTPRAIAHAQDALTWGVAGTDITESDSTLNYTITQTIKKRETI